MRTTLDINDDVLMAVKEVAQRERSTVGQVLSRLARQALLAPDGAAAGPKLAPPSTARRLERLGIRSLPLRGDIVTNELIDRIREQEGI